MGFNSGFKGLRKIPHNGSRDAADEVGCRPHILLITLHRRITLEDGPDALTRNVGNELPISPAKHPRTARISHRGRSLISRNPTSITVILFNGIKWSFIGLLDALDFLTFTIKFKITVVHLLTFGINHVQKGATGRGKYLETITQSTGNQREECKSHETKLTLVYDVHYWKIK